MKHPVDVHVGQRVRQQRWIIGMTQQQLAARVGIKFQQIQKYETGMNRISASRLWDIAEALQVPVHYFFEGLDSKDGENGKGSNDTAADHVTDKESAELLRSYWAMPEIQRRKFYDLIRSMSKVA
jgi:transcriptional regulator with XRE-family HTH domain